MLFGLFFFASFYVIQSFGQSIGWANKDERFDFFIENHIFSSDFDGARNLMYLHQIIVSSDLDLN